MRRRRRIGYGRPMRSKWDPLGPRASPGGRRWRDRRRKARDERLRLALAGARAGARARPPGRRPALALGARAASGRRYGAGDHVARERFNRPAKVLTSGRRAGFWRSRLAVAGAERSASALDCRARRLPSAGRSRRSSSRSSWRKRAWSTMSRRSSTALGVEGIEGGREAVAKIVGRDVSDTRRGGGRARRDRIGGGEFFRRRRGAGLLVSRCSASPGSSSTSSSTPPIP